jgi:hypothetical protein
VTGWITSAISRASFRRDEVQRSGPESERDAPDLRALLQEQERARRVADAEGLRATRHDRELVAVEGARGSDPVEVQHGSVRVEHAQRVGALRRAQFDLEGAAHGHRQLDLALASAHQRRIEPVGHDVVATDRQHHPFATDPLEDDATVQAAEHGRAVRPDTAEGVPEEPHRDARERSPVARDDVSHDAPELAIGEDDRGRRVARVERPEGAHLERARVHHAHGVVALEQTREAHAALASVSREHQYATSSGDSPSFAPR